MRSFISLCVLCSLCVFGLPYSAHAQTKVKFIKNTDAQITINKSGGKTDVSVTNNNKYPISLQFTVTGENFASNVDFPHQFVIPPGTEAYAFTVQRDRQGKKWNWRYRYSWKSGSVYANHNVDYLYRVPFAVGEEITIGQSCFGDFTHHGPSQYAVDLIVPEGTPIHAAREGVVSGVKYDSNVGGTEERMKSEANYVHIIHPDGTRARYSHLQHNGVIVRPNQEISRGEVIGYSGNTGYSTTPHLHFEVSRRVFDEKSQTLQFIFAAKEGQFSCPETGQVLTVRQ